MYSDLFSVYIKFAQMMSSMLNTVNGDTIYNVTSEITLMLFFSREHCINDKIKNIATGSHNTFSDNDLHSG